MRILGIIFVYFKNLHTFHYRSRFPSSELTRPISPKNDNFRFENEFLTKSDIFFLIFWYFEFRIIFGYFCCGTGDVFYEIGLFWLKTVFSTEAPFSFIFAWNIFELKLMPGVGSVKKPISVKIYTFWNEIRRIILPR